MCTHMRADELTNKAWRSIKINEKNSARTLVRVERPGIGMAVTLLREISKDEHERARLRSRRMYETDRESDRLTSEEIGEIRGEARANEKWQVIVANKETEISNKKAENEQLRLRIAELEKRQ